MSFARPPHARPARARALAVTQQPSRGATLLASGVLCTGFWAAVVYAALKLAALG